jgi:hypothetical protein
MTDSHDPSRFASELLRQDEPLSDSEYQEYRGKLENALMTTARREKRAGRFLIASLVISFTLMFVGGSKLLGSFDPWSKDATFVSAALGLVFSLAIAIFLLSACTYFWWFQPGVKDAKERLRDANILDLQRQIRELREKAAPIARHEKPTPEKPQSDSHG